MATYEGKVKLRNNSVIAVKVQARNEKEAREHMARRGRVLTITKKITVQMGRGLSPADRQIFFARLSAMLSSRVGTSTALTLMRDTFGGKIQEVSARLISEVEDGKNLAEAMTSIGSPDFPEATIALVHAGSRSGETGKAIRDAATFERELLLVKKGAAKGLATGVFGFVLAGVLTMVSTLYIGPQIMDSPLIKSANVNIDWVNDIAYAIGYFMAFLMVVGLGFWLFASVGRRIMPQRADKLILKVPYYKDLVLSRNNFIVLYGLALLVQSGVRIEEALHLTAKGAPRGALKADLMAAEKEVREGRPWPKNMSTLHPTDKAALMSATDREQVAQTIDTLARQYRELYAQRLASFVPMLNVLAALFLTVSGGLLFGQTILPMLMASQNIVG